MDNAALAGVIVYFSVTLVCDFFAAAADDFDTAMVVAIGVLLSGLIEFMIVECYNVSGKLNLMGGIKVAIIVNIYYSGVDGNAKKFAQEMISSGIVGDIRAENGNIKYEYFFPMYDEETLLLIDGWKDQHSIDVHHASPMMAKIIELREKYDLHMRVERFVSDETGVTEIDKAFIKE